MYWNLLGGITVKWGNVGGAILMWRKSILTLDDLYELFPVF